MGTVSQQQQHRGIFKKQALQSCAAATANSKELNSDIALVQNFGQVHLKLQIAGVFDPRSKGIRPP